MHTFTDIEKKMLKALRDQSITDIGYLGIAIKDVFFTSRKCALYLEPSQRQACLFYPTNEKHADRQTFSRLISLITFIEYLQQENLVYLQPTQMNHEVLFYQNFDHSFLLGGKYDPDVKHAITKDEFLRIDLSPTPATVKLPNGGSVQAGQVRSDLLFITDAKGNRFLQSTDVSSLYDKLYSLLCCRAFPTETLRRFIQNGYCTDDENRNKRSLILSRASFLVALLALILTSPWVATPYSNQHGYTTIDQTQFDTLKSAIKASCVIQPSDSIKEPKKPDTQETNKEEKQK